MPESIYQLEKHPDFGFFQVKPTPSPEEIKKYYQQEFYSKSYPQFNNSALEAQAKDQEYFDGQREDICAGISNILGKSLNGLSVLDIGCGWSQTLLYFKKKGMECFGFEPSPEAVQYAQSQGLKVVQSDIESVNIFGNQKFDVVTIFNVLEHLSDPVETLSNVKAVLKSGGILIIEVPNDFNVFQMVGQSVHRLPQWWVSPPAHLNYFNCESLSKLLNHLSYQVNLAEASFPLEMFLLFGHNYVEDRALGRRCHEQRMLFELNMRKHGQAEALRSFYQLLANQNLGRSLRVYARLSP